MRNLRLMPVNQINFNLAPFDKNPYFPRNLFGTNLYKAKFSTMILDLLEQILPHVRNSIYPSIIPIHAWKVKEGDIENAHAPSLRDQSWGDFQVPAQWGGYNRTVWFRTKVTVPKEFEEKTIGLVLDLPEALLYLNGKPLQGVNLFHDEVILSKGSRAGETFSIAIQAYSGRKPELNKFTHADFVVIDTTARTLYNRLRILSELDKLAGPGGHESKEIRELIRRTLIFLKYFKPGSEEYPNAIARANNFLERTLETEFHTTSAGLIHLISHSHIDVAWLWALKETRRKVGRTFSTILRLMEEYPDFTFSHGQAQLYQFAKENYPDLYEQIKNRIIEGRWEIAGSAWVEPDCNLLSGESLVRQILFGRKFFKEEFGLEPSAMWLPDTFGFPASLPQLLKKSGISFFSTSKLLANDTTRFPYNTFLWKGNDGSEVLTHIPPVGLDAQLNPRDLKRSWEEFRQQESHTKVLQTFGYGNGGNGPTKEQLDTGFILRNIISLPQSKLSTLREFFAELQSSDELPQWNDELYLEKHRGTYTTQAWIKKENRECETLLFNAELFSVLGLLASKAYPAKQLEGTWKKLLLNQFHDILGGASIAAVYDEARKDFIDIRQTTSNLIRQQASRIVNRSSKKNEFHFTLFNPLPWTRNGYITLNFKSKLKTFRVTDEEGEPVETQILGTRRGNVALLCYVKNLPPLTFSTITVVASLDKSAEEENPPESQWTLAPKKVETPLFRARLNKRGQFVSLQDRRFRRDIVKSGEFGNQFQTLWDKPRQWHASDIGIESMSKRVELFKTKSVKVVESGPLRGSLKIFMKTQNGSTITQQVFFYHKEPRIDFETSVKWAEQHVMLKVAFPINVKSHMASHEIPFGSVTRTTKPKSPGDVAKFEVPLHQWADISDTKFGVTLINNCKYGFDAHDTTLRLTLLRSPFYPHPTEPWNQNDVKVTDQGTHSFSYSLYPHAGDWKKSESVRRAREFNNPVLVFEGKPKFSFPPFLRISHPAVQLSTIKKAEASDEVIVRAYESHGDSAKTTIAFGHRLLQAMECDLMENDVAKLKPAKGKLQLSFKPFEIKTIRVKLKGKIRKG